MPLLHGLETLSKAAGPLVIVAGIFYFLFGLDTLDGKLSGGEYAGRLPDGKVPEDGYMMMARGALGVVAGTLVTYFGYRPFRSHE